MALKSICVLAGTGTTGIKQVKILPNVTGPSGTFKQARQLTGFTGPTGTFQNVQNANAYVAGMQEIIISGYTSPTGAVPAVLSSPSLVTINNVSMTATGTSDTASGTFYVVVSTNSSTPTAAQIIAGKDSTGSTAAFASSVTPIAGANAFTATGLTASTAYYAFFAQTSTGGNSNVIGAGPVSTQSALVAAFLARTSGLDATHTNAYSALIDGLVADSVWAKLDWLHVYATKDSATALLNLVSTSYNGTANGSPTFTPDRGFTGVSSSSTVWINPAFNPVTAVSPLFARDSAHISFWATSDTGTAPGACIGFSDLSTISTDIIPTLGDGNVYFQMNSTTFTSGGANANPKGHYIGNRSANNAIQGYKNGASIITNTTASVALVSLATAVLARNNNGSVSGSNAQCGAASMGSSLSATDAANLYTRLRTYMTAVGAP